MGTDRGAANLARYNEARSAPVVPKLQHELRLTRKRKLEFQSIGLLAAYLEDRVKVHRTTLTRNVTYKGMLLIHLAGQPGAVSRTPDSTRDPAILQAKLAAAKLEASNKGTRLSHADALLERVHRGLVSSDVRHGSDVAFANLAMVMVNMLHRFPDFVQLDRQKRELHDLSAKPSEQLIAGKERMSEFVEWVEVNQALPMVKALVLGSAGRPKNSG